MENCEISVDSSSLETFQAAAIECAQPEVDRIAKIVIEDLRNRSANGAFGDLHAQNLWDEYCWNIQEGPFDDEFEWGDVSFGSTSSAFEDLVSVVALTEVEKLPKHMQTFMSALAFDREPNFASEDPWSTLGVIWPDGMAKLVVDQVNEVASRRFLYLIGPDRADCIRSETSGEGVVWALLEDRDNAWEIVADHIDDLLDLESDLEPLAEALLDGFIAAAKEDTEHSRLSEFFEEYEMDIRNLLLAGDVMTNVRKMRAQVVKRLDG